MAGKDVTKHHPKANWRLKKLKAPEFLDWTVRRHGKNVIFEYVIKVGKQ